MKWREVQVIAVNLKVADKLQWYIFSLWELVVVRIWLSATLASFVQTDDKNRAIIITSAAFEIDQWNLITWGSSSSIKSKMASMAASCKEGKWLKNFVMKLGANFFSPSEPFVAWMIPSYAEHCCNKMTHKIKVDFEYKYIYRSQRAWWWSPAEGKLKYSRLAWNLAGQPNQHRVTAYCIVLNFRKIYTGPCTFWQFKLLQYWNTEMSKMYYVHAITQCYCCEQKNATQEGPAYTHQLHLDNSSTKDAIVSCRKWASERCFLY